MHGCKGFILGTDNIIVLFFEKIWYVESRLFVEMTQWHSYTIHFTDFW